MGDEGVIENIVSDPVLTFEDQYVEESQINLTELRKNSNNKELKISYDDFILIGENPKAVLALKKIDSIQILLTELSSVTLELIKDDFSSVELMKIYTSLADMITKTEYNKKIIKKIKQKI